MLDFLWPRRLPPAALTSSWFVVDIAWSKDFRRVSLDAECDALSEEGGPGAIWMRMGSDKRETRDEQKTGARPVKHTESPLVMSPKTAVRHFEGATVEGASSASPPLSFVSMCA